MQEGASTDPFAKLQEIDLALGRLTSERIARNSAASRAEASAKAATAELARVDALLVSATKRQREIDQELKSIDAEIAKFDMAAKNANKASAFEAANDAASKLRLRMDELEGAGLEVLEQVEQLTEKRKQAADRLAADETRLADSRASLKEWELSGGAQEVECRAAEAEVLLGLPIGLADAVRDAALSGRPVFTRVKDGSCMACGAEMSSSFINRPANDPPSPCPSCGKILLPG
jgi:predicted  nucleic acid-binding Zn-ribbon protein